MPEYAHALVRARVDRVRHPLHPLRGRGLRPPIHRPCQHQRRGLLAAERIALRTTRHLRGVGQLRVERAEGGGERTVAASGGRRLRRRRARTELHLHRAAAAVDRLRRRHPPREPQPAASLQGAVRDVEHSRRLRVGAVLASSAVRPFSQCERRGDLRRVRRRACLGVVVHVERGARPRSAAEGARLSAGAGRPRVDQSRLQGVLHGRARDPVLGIAERRSQHDPPVVSAADDDAGLHRAVQSSSPPKKDSGRSGRCSRGT